MKLSIRRLVAYWLDFVLLAFILIGLQLLLYSISSGFPFQILTAGYQIELWVLSSMSLPVWTYFILCERYKQQTIGKRLLKLVVINHDGGAINTRQAFIRTAIRLLPWELTHLILLIPTPWWNVEEPENMFLIIIPNLMIMVYVLFLMINKGTRALHDYLAKTQVRTR
ncbi:RDD family protein [Paenibacillus marinisediminis]